MLTQIKLTNFKCFKEETTFPLGKLNLLTGVNGAGKSTLLQSLLLMKQSITFNPFTNSIVINDDNGVSLGNFEDVKNRDVSRLESVFFEFEIGNKDFKNTIHYHLQNNAEDASLHVQEVTISPRVFKNSEFSPVYRFHYLENVSTNAKKQVIYQIQDDSKLNNYVHLYKLSPQVPSLVFINGHPHYPMEDWRKCDVPNINVYSHVQGTQLESGDELNFDRIHYVSADRIGPREIHKQAPLTEFPNVGAKGEFAVNLLHRMAQESVDEALCLEEDRVTLLAQTEAWLGKILNPLTLKTKQLSGNLLELLMGDFLPSNVGFGYSSILPIIVSGLIAKPGEKLIIENPEIHLHPKAQTALIQFLAKVANTGVQVFIESHSDHVLNALRIIVLKQQLEPNDLNVLFFTKTEDGQPKIVKPTIDNQGRFDLWLEDFFDETAKNLATLAATGQRSRVKAPQPRIS